MNRTHCQEQHPRTNFAPVSAMAGDSSPSSSNCCSELYSSKQTICPKLAIIVSLAKYSKKQNDCPFCQQHLTVIRCPHYLESFIQDRIQLVCISRKKTASRPTAVKPNCGAQHYTSLHVSDSRNSRPRLKKTYPDKQQDPTSTQTAENRLNTTAIHLKSSDNNSCQPPFNPSQFNATVSVDPEINQFPKTLLALLQVIPVSPLNGDNVFDTYALIDPGSTGTYVLDSISRSLNLETGHQVDLDVQF